MSTKENSILRSRTWHRSVFKVTNIVPRWFFWKQCSLVGSLVIWDFRICFHRSVNTIFHRKRLTKIVQNIPTWSARRIYRKQNFSKRYFEKNWRTRIKIHAKYRLFTISKEKNNLEFKYPLYESNYVGILGTRYSRTF